MKINLTFTLLVLGAMLIAASCTNSSSEKNQKPNIVYILSDDLGYGDLGVYGQNKIETPNIDQLAKDGMKFTQHYAGAPVCAPSRSVLLTGKHLGHSLVRGNDEWAKRGKVWDYRAVIADSTLEGQFPIPAGTVTIGRLLQQGGCKIAVVSKDTDPYELANYAPYTLKEYSPELMFGRITRFVDENKDKPFFLYWASPIPHAALQAPKRWVDYYVKKFGDEEPYVGNKGYFPTRDPHATMVSYLDENVDELVKQLKDLFTKAEYGSR